MRKTEQVDDLHLAARLSDIPASGQKVVLICFRRSLKKLYIKYLFSVLRKSCTLTLLT